MPNETIMSNDTLSVFADLVSRSLESSAGLGNKVDNLAKEQERQSSKLDGLLIAMAEVKQLNTNLGQRIDVNERDLRDHEARMRLLESAATTGNDYRRRIEASERIQEVHEKTINDLNNKITRYVAIAGTLLLATQFIITTFIAPWVQNIMYGN